MSSTSEPPRVGRVPTPDGRRLATHSWGEGPDLVVLEAGMGASGRSWGAVARALAYGPLADQLTVVAYDRAGMGHSTPDARPRTLERLASDLVTVVTAQRARRVVLVGHSWGGPIVRTAAPMLGDLVAGVVLVDPSQEDAEAYRSRTFAAGERLQAAVAPTLARTGVLRAVMGLVARGLPEPDRAATVEGSSSPTAVRTYLAEGECLLQELDGLAHVPHPDGVPLTIISGTKPSLDASRRQFVETHRRHAASVPGGRFVGAEKSHHMVPFTEPGLIAAEVLRLLWPTGGGSGL